MLPILLSIPHGGTRAPDEIQSRVVLSEADLFADIDAFTRELYDVGDAVATVHVAEVARTFVDLNRAPDDRPPANPDGVFKTTTCHGRRIYREGADLPDELMDTLIERYHRPYHEALDRSSDGVRLALDCHSMAKEPPLISPDRGRDRPLFCLSNGDGLTCESRMLEAARDAFAEAFSCAPSEIRLNDPFKGGYITRHHGAGSVPWIQVEMNRVWYLAPPWFDPATRDVEAERLTDLRGRFLAALSALPLP